MGKDSAIEWTHHTFNPWWGCTKVSPGCAHCYAEASAQRWGFKVWGKKASRRFFGHKRWREPLAWNLAAEREGQRKRVFCASMADVFEDDAELDHWRAQLWKLIEATPWLDWLLLTKRPENVATMAPWGSTWPPNVWLGTTVENAEWAAKRISALLQYPAAIRFLSAEPLLGPIDLSPWLSEIDWVIAGGESGNSARPMQPGWARSLRDQCVEAGVAFHFKQWGMWQPTAVGELVPSRIAMPGASGEEGVMLVRLGKKKAGRELDGRTWDELPSGDRGRPPKPGQEQRQEEKGAAVSMDGSSNTTNHTGGETEPEAHAAQPSPDHTGAAAPDAVPRRARVLSEALPPDSNMRLVAVSEILIPPNRKPDPDVVRQLVLSIADLGLLNPIILTPEGELVAGLHRVAAYVELGWTPIEARIETWGRIDQQMIEIDENLIRRRLTVLERGRMLARRKELYEAIHPEARQHARGGHAKAAAEGANETISPAAAFAVDAAGKLGTSERTVQEEIRIAVELSPDAAEILLGTPIEDEKVKLMELTRLPRDRQAAVAQLLVEGRAKSVTAAVTRLRRDTKEADASTAKLPEIGPLQEGSPASEKPPNEIRGETPAKAKPAEGSEVESSKGGAGAQRVEEVLRHLRSAETLLSEMGVNSASPRKGKQEMNAALSQITAARTQIEAVLTMLTPGKPGRAPRTDVDARWGSSKVDSSSGSELKHVWTLHRNPAALDGPVLAVRRRVLAAYDDLVIEIARHQATLWWPDLEEFGCARTHGLLAHERGCEVSVWVYDHCPSAAERAEWLRRRAIENAALTSPPPEVWILQLGVKLGSPDIAVRGTTSRAWRTSPRKGEFAADRSKIYVQFLKNRGAMIDLLDLVTKGKASAIDNESLWFYLVPPTLEERKRSGEERRQRAAERQRREAEQARRGGSGAQERGEDKHAERFRQSQDTLQHEVGETALASFGLKLPCRTADVNRAFRRIITKKKMHPDQGGSDEAMRKLTALRDTALLHLERNGGARAA